MIKLAETPLEWLYHGLNHARPPIRDSAYKRRSGVDQLQPFGQWKHEFLAMGRCFALGKQGTAGKTRSNVGTVLHINISESTVIVAADIP